MSNEGNTENATHRDRRKVALLECVECHSLSSLRALGWRGYRVDDPEANEPPALAFYCPACSAREFGHWKGKV